MDEIETTCAICLEVISSAKMTLECGHVFHTKCGITWLRKNKTCPNCRETVETEEPVEMVANSEPVIPTVLYHDICDICQKPLREKCLECSTENNPFWSCNLSLGHCGHSHHFHCINRSLRQQNICTVCLNEYELARVF